MLLAHSFESEPSDIYFNYTTGTAEAAVPMLNSLNMAASYYDQPQDIIVPTQPCNLNEVAQALEIARESPDGARDPIISNILETYLSQVWDRVLAQPDTYVMSRDEFAVFNFFQHRFAGNKIAITARKRYWDNVTGCS
ncbi:hypothetical protein F5X96DRAFT_202822 [Biscogniauxia mediterranea]|nr:hypothetical protein F5X96DRAFT_202822 [Biscogniauxia mediterranea]